MLDIALIGGTVVDPILGSKELDLGIRSGRIERMDSRVGPAKESLNVSGLTVCPGFVDIHLHEDGMEWSDKPTFHFPKRHRALEAALLQGVTSVLVGNCGFSYDQVSELLDRADAEGLPVNTGTLVGQGQLRRRVGVDDPSKPATKMQRRRIAELLREQMAQGALGVSMGLEYEPGTTFDEALDACREAAALGRLVAVHYREDAGGARDSITEMAGLARASQCSVQVSHIGSCAAFGQMAEVLGLLEDNVAAGGGLMADCYPYTAFATAAGTPVFADGFTKRYGCAWEQLEIATGPLAGARCTEALLRKVRSESPGTFIIAHLMKEEEVLLALAHPAVMIASDGGFIQGKGHPRGAGTFARALGLFREEPSLGRKDGVDLAMFLKKMTVLPGERMGFPGKGRLLEGGVADVVVFDPSTIADKATYQDPLLPPSGVAYVIVNGKIAVRHGTLESAHAGSALRPPKPDGV